MILRVRRPQYFICLSQWLLVTRQRLSCEKENMSLGRLWYLLRYTVNSI